MSTQPIMLMVYALLVLFGGEIVYLFYCAYFKGRRKW